MCVRGHGKRGHMATGTKNITTLFIIILLFISFLFCVALLGSPAGVSTYVAKSSDKHSRETTMTQSLFRLTTFSLFAPRLTLTVIRTSIK